MLEIKVLHSLLKVSLNIGLFAFFMSFEFCDNMRSMRYRLHYICQGSVVCVIGSCLLCPYLVCFLSSSDVIMS